ncbi:MAG: ParB/RepB/Spo0J family partition protein [Kiritimatiellae bacterium]|nr:ParB/RepB/Spo0J family partition protein [Kiritimatiellia bacterium]
MAAKHGLGRGLDALIKGGTVAVGQPGTTREQQTIPLTRVPVDKIRRSDWQPRRVFDPETLAELTESIRQKGVLQPLLVRTKGDGYELIAGERRLRAAREAGLKEVPVVVMDVGDNAALELALVENLQREDLNPIEEAEGYRTLLERFRLTQEQIAERVGKARSSVANALRLLELPEEVRHLVASGELSVGHAKALLALPIPEEQVLYARRAIKENLSVRSLEKLVQKATLPPRKPRVWRADLPKEHLAYLTERLQRHLGTSVRVTPCRTFANGKKGRGVIEIDFYSNDDLDRILACLGIREES